MRKEKDMQKPPVKKEPPKIITADHAMSFVKQHWDMLCDLFPGGAVSIMIRFDQPVPGTPESLLFLSGEHNIETLHKAIDRAVEKRNQQQAAAKSVVQ